MDNFPATPTRRPCSNCGREGGGVIGSSAWGHAGMCCSEACGKRLQAKIAGGMAERPAGWDSSDWDDGSWWRIARMRARIKVLEARLKAAKTPEANRSQKMSDKGRGLYEKFHVTRNDGSDQPGGKHDGCEYFVLDLKHDPHAKPALRAYAESCKEDYPQLAADLKARTWL